MNHFGPHLTLDLQKCDPESLTDYRAIYNLLNTLPEKIGMTKMTLPYVVTWLDKNATVPGISGFVMIAESHISIHTFPEKNYVFIDIFSCKEFDIEKAKRFLTEPFSPQKITEHVIKRGLDFHKEEGVPA